MRAKLDTSNDSLNKKIRNAETQKVPYMLIVGEKEAHDNSVSVREYKTKEQYVLPAGEFSHKVLTQYQTRAL
ncbi:MAG: hypothetical protein H6765_01335 [Candidatus Peribacteria bacterium]|nr:MAG: hypothetical protein H6765_01335 [Candidatus Peribacteria bacterium]